MVRRDRLGMLLLNVCNTRPSKWESKIEEGETFHAQQRGTILRLTERDIESEGGRI
jgi:hypothetical protein